MGLNNLGLGFVFTARDLASGKIRGLERNFKKLDGTTQAAADNFGKNLKRVGIGLAGFTVGAVGVAAGFKLAGVFGDFEQTLAGAGAIMRASTEDLELLKKAAIDAGIATQFDPSQAAEGLTVLGAQGFNTAEAIEALIPTLDLAAASLGKLGVADAASVAASALKVFDLETSDLSLTVDKLTRISNKTALQADDLQIALANVARGAKATGAELDEMLIALGLVKNVGVDASVAGTAVASALDFMARRAPLIKSKLGVAVTDATGKFRPFLDIVLEANKALGEKFPNEAKRAAVQTKLFGRFGKTAFLAVGSALEKGVRDNEGTLLKGAAAIAFLRSEIEGAAGAAGEMRGALLDTFKGQKQLLTGTVSTLAIVIGEGFAGILQPVITGVTNALNLLIRGFQKLPGPVKEVIAVVFVVTSAFVAAAGAVIFFKAVMKLLGPSIKEGIASMRLLLGTMAPFLLIAALIGAAIFLIKKAFETNFLGIRDAFVPVLDAFSEVGAIFRDELLPALGELFKAVLPIFKVLIKVLVGVLKAVAPILKVVIQVFAFVLVGVAKVLTVIFRVLAGVVRDIAGFFIAFGQAIVTVFSAVADFLSPIVDLIKKIIAGMKEGIDFAKLFFGFITGEDPTAGAPPIVGTIEERRERIRAARQARDAAAASPAVIPIAAAGAAAAQAVPGGAAVPIEIRTTIELDGEKVAEAVNKANAAEATETFGAAETE